MVDSFFVGQTDYVIDEPDRGEAAALAESTRDLLGSALAILEENCDKLDEQQWGGALFLLRQATTTARSVVGALEQQAKGATHG